MGKIAHSAVFMGWFDEGGVIEGGWRRWGRKGDLVRGVNLGALGVECQRRRVGSRGREMRDEGREVMDPKGFLSCYFDWLVKIWEFFIMPLGSFVYENLNI